MAFADAAGLVAAGMVLILMAVAAIMGLAYGAYRARMRREQTRQDHTFLPAKAVEELAQVNDRIAAQLVDASRVSERIRATVRKGTKG